MPGGKGPSGSVLGCNTTLEWGAAARAQPPAQTSPPKDDPAHPEYADPKWDGSASLRTWSRRTGR
ncbi:MAG: hypothetical protein U1F43_03725 [Myxococcota bacterium]